MIERLSVLSVIYKNFLQLLKSKFILTKLPKKYNHKWKFLSEPPDVTVDMQKCIFVLLKVCCF